MRRKEINKYHVVHNGILVDRFNKYSNIAKDKSQFVVGYAGRITANKGIGVLLKAVYKLHDIYQDIRFNFVGAVDGDFLEKLKCEITRSGMDEYVSYNGSETDIEKFYKSIDVLVLLSLVKEAFVLVLCEAMYCGVPVISSNSGAQAEIIEDGIDGFILDEVTDAAITEIILKIYEKRLDVRLLVSNMKNKVVTYFNVVNAVDELYVIYNKI